MATKHTRKRILWILCGVAVLVAGAAASYWIATAYKPKSPLPAAVSKQVSFIVYFPGKDWHTSGKTISYASGVLTLHTSQTDITLTMTEQATPQVFNDIPQYYPSLVNKLNEYSSFGTLNGTVYLTKPKELNGQQQAVLNNNGTLIFVHSSHNLSDNAWRRFFNDIEVLKP